MGTNLLGELAADQGTFILNGEESTFNMSSDGLKVDKIIFTQGSSNIIHLKYTLDGPNVADEYLFNPTGTITNGTIIAPKGNKQFESVSINGNAYLILG